MEELPFMPTDVIPMECECWCIFCLHTLCVLLNYTSNTENHLNSFSKSNIGVKLVVDRKQLHEAIHINSMDAGVFIKGQGKSNDLLERIAKYDLFKVVHDKLDTFVDPKLFIGRAKDQMEEFWKRRLTQFWRRRRDFQGRRFWTGLMTKS